MPVKKEVKLSPTSNLPEPTRRKLKLTNREAMISLQVQPDRLLNGPHEWPIHLEFSKQMLKRRRIPIAVATFVLLVVGIIVVCQIVAHQRPRQVIAEFFSPGVQYWAPQIKHWSDAYKVDPNLIAVIMQIESCGLPNAVSSSGAQGLFQVMPTHFTQNESMLDPETNARRGVGFLRDCLNWTNDDVGRALACYNGGPTLINRPFSRWPTQTQRYFVWGIGLYNESRAHLRTSPTLTAWLNYGGASLCERARTALNVGQG
jgi:hypothetical protein